MREEDLPEGDQREEDLSGKLLVAERVLGDFFTSYDPDLYTVDGAKEMLTRMANMSRLLDAGTLKTARRLEKAHVHEREGFKNAAGWLSTITGQPVGQAAASLQAARAIEEHPEISEAFSSGRISGAQAKEIATAADACPNEAARLVEQAPSQTFSDLKKNCGQVRSIAASAEEEMVRHEKIRAKRYCRMWTDSEGAGRLEARMTPDALGVLKACLGPFVKEVFEDARKSGMRDSAQAYAADALLAMAAMSASRGGRSKKTTPGTEAVDDADSSKANDASSNGPRPLIRIRVDLGALLRGHTVAGETCSIPGIQGAIPVALVRSLVPEALLELVITKGTDVTTVVSDSRYVSRALAIALEERDPICCVPNCDASDPLERDHYQDDFSKGGKTKLENLARLCPWHHHLKTHKRWRFDGSPGRWRFIPPAQPARAVNGITNESGMKRQNSRPNQQELL